MDVDISIKEEIHIDDCDMDSEEQSTNLEYEDDDGRILKDEQPEENNNTLNIIEERDNMITVSVGELYSEDERNFIENFNFKEMFADTTQSSIIKVCAFCKKVFTNEDSFLDHKMNGLCQYLWKQPFSCQVCFLTFEGTPKLDKHIRLHQRNMHFCNTGCGKFFRKLDLCCDHEYRDHTLDPQAKLKCWICKAVFPSSNQLIQHKGTQHSYVRRHVCSLCRTEFMTGVELNAHWKISSCGFIKFDKQVLNSGGELVLQNINYNMETTTTTSPISNNNNNNNNKRKFDSEMESFTFKRIEIPPRKRADNEDAFNSFNGIKIKNEPIDEENIDISNKFIEDMVEEMKLEMKCEPVYDYSEDNYFNTPSSSAKPLFTPIDINKLRLPSIQKTTTESVKKLDKTSNGNTKNQGTKNSNMSKLRILKEFADAVNGSGSVVINGDANKRSYMVNKNNNTNPKNAITLVHMTPSNKNNTQHLLTNENDQQYNNNNNRPWNVVTLPPNTKIVPISVVNITSQNNRPFVPKQISIINTAQIQKGGGGDNSPPSTSASSSAATTSTSVLHEVPSKPKNQPNQKLMENTVNISPPSIVIKKSRNRRIISLTNDTMNYIENLPKSKKIIEDMKRQIRSIEQDQTSGEATSVKDIPKVNLAEISNDINTYSSDGEASFPITRIGPPLPLQPPSSLYLNLNNATDDKLLSRIRKDHPDYRFSWMCPQCPRQYELKYAFRGHLQTMHYLTERRIDFVKMEVRPFKLIDLLDIVKNKTTIERQPVELRTYNNGNVSIPEKQLMEFDESTCSSIQSDKTSDTKIIDKIMQRANNGKFVCQKCRLDFPTMQLLENHQKGICSKPRKYECTVCSKRFSASGTLNCHMSIHTGELPHKCDYCDKRFRTRGQVTVHHRTHTGERPFTCQICSLGFTHRETLISHLSRHIGMKRYKCYGCEKTFSCISGLRTHRDVRPETCGRVKFSPRAIGPRVRVVKGNVFFEQQPEVNPYLRSEQPPVSN